MEWDTSPVSCNLGTDLVHFRLRVRVVSRFVTTRFATCEVINVGSVN